MKSIQSSLIIASLFAVSACTGNNKEAPEKEPIASETITIPIVNITKKFTTKEICLQEIAEVNYIPLETSDKVLLDNYGRIAFSSSEKIIAINSEKGDVFFFDGKGKIVSQFNRKGQSGQEYQSILTLIYDEENNEIIIQDFPLMKRFQVYDENGKHKRTLSYPKDCEFENVMNYDKETFIAYENHNVNYAEKINLARKKPYVFLSKKDGSIVSEIDLELEERISTHFSIKVEGGTAAFRMSAYYIFKYDKGFILSDIACDTVFYYDEQRTLSPLLIREPSIQGMNDPKTVMFFGKPTKDYFFFSTFRNEYNFSTKEMGEMVDLVYDRKNRETFSSKIYNEDFPTHERSASLSSHRVFRAHTLTEALEQNKLKGKLKEIAKQLDPDDNPVMISVKVKQ